MITIGILGSKGKSNVAELIESNMKKHNKISCIIGTHQETYSEFVKLLFDEIDYAIIEISREDIIQGALGRIIFDIIIETSLENENNELIEDIQGGIEQIREGGYIIFNSDSVQKINFQCDKIYPITYGLNGKTTVTASSIDDFDGLRFSYCLQRTLFTITGSIIQPFEIPAKVDGEYEEIYYHLASLTCSLILGFSL
jgi:UDP-N-acetylmuramoyl-L-alanyl-D-glutamate--2,6-diaminopimelate ligase